MSVPKIIATLISLILAIGISLYPFKKAIWDFANSLPMSDAERIRANAPNVQFDEAYGHLIPAT